MTAADLRDGGYTSAADGCVLHSEQTEQAEDLCLVCIIRHHSGALDLAAVHMDFVATLCS